MPVKHPDPEGPETARWQEIARRFRNEMDAKIHPERRQRATADEIRRTVQPKRAERRISQPANEGDREATSMPEPKHTGLDGLSWIEKFNHWRRTWTIFGIVRWLLTGVVVMVAITFLTSLLDENFRTLIEDHHWDRVILAGSEMIPEMLSYRAAWLSIGMLFGACGAIWLIWAFPHRLGESTAHQSQLKKWGTAGAIALATIASFAMLYFSPIAVGPSQTENEGPKGKPAISGDLNAANDELAKSKIPPVDSILALAHALTQSQNYQDGLSSQNADLKSQLSVLQQQIATLQTQQVTPTPPLSGGPIDWQPRILLHSVSGQPNVGLIRLTGTVRGLSVVQLKDGYIVSGLTGEKRSFLISTHAGDLGAQTLPIDQINPLSPGLQVDLLVQFTPPLPVQEFYNQWGKMYLTVDYDNTSYQRYFDEDKIRSDILSDIVGADSLIAAPRVTKKNSQ